MKKLVFNFLLLAICSLCHVQAYGQQQNTSAETKNASKIEYAQSLEMAQKQAYQKKKLIFVNCYASWANPCLAMDHYVFSNQDFANYMNKTFINVFADMSTEDGKKIAQKYGVKSFAYFLILDYKGDIVQKISGGAKLPEFKEKVDIALDSKKSLAGSAKKYNSGKYAKKDVYNYLNALQVAGEDSLFKKVGNEYMAMLTEKEYSEKKNWIVANINRNRQGEYYNYLIKNKPLFIKGIGEKQVNGYIESLFGSDVLGYATGNTEYDAEKLNALGKEIKEANLPDTCLISIVYGIAKLRGERKFHELYDYMNENGHYFINQPGLRPFIELSFNFEEINDNEKSELVNYLIEASKREQGVHAKRLASFAEVIKKGNRGIEFEHLSFNELLAKAKKENKLVFIDCYTSWCGPCRNMANNVFTQQEVGKYFNTHFVNAKIDMEKGEGVELAKKYKVSAFPTLIFLDAEGNCVETIVGYRSPEKLLEAVKNIKGK